MVSLVSRRLLTAFLVASAVSVQPGLHAQVSPRAHYSTARLNAQPSGISLAVTSFHRNGTNDLLTGYATSTGGALVMQNGAPEALALSKAEIPNLIAGGNTVPFRENAVATELPVRPDLPAAVSASAPQTRYSSKHLESERALPLSITAGTAKLRAKLAAGTGVSLLVTDFDSDGTQDVLSGYATSTGGALLLQRGSPVALAPTPTEWAMQAAGQLVAPYVPKAEPIELPVRPDLLKSADIHGHGFADLVFAQKGDTSLYLALNDGRGHFTAATAVPLSGSIHSLATWRAASGDNLLVAGVCGSQGCGLQFLDRDGLTKAFVATPGPVTAIEIGSIDLGSRLDLALIAGGKVLVLDGDTALGTGPTLETLPVSGAVAIALGTFVPDHHAGLQIAVLDNGATLHVLTRQGIDASYNPELRQAQIRATAARIAAVPHIRPQIQPEPKRTGLPWTEAETVPNLGAGGSATMFRARLSGGGNDDLAVVRGSQYITVAHPVVREAGFLKTTPIVTVDSTSSSVAAMVPARISADSRQGTVTLDASGGGLHPLTIGVPTSNRTMMVNTNTDATPTTASKNLCINGQPGCQLRSAITVANLDQAANGEAKVDTINIAPNTYYLIAPNVNSSGTTQTYDYLGSLNYHLVVEASMNLVGTVGTIINANHIDMVMAVDYGSFYATYSGDFESAPIDVFISGLTLENGTNPNTDGAGNCNTGNCNYHGGNLTWEVEGPSNLVLNNVIITNGTNARQGGGGGVYISYDDSSSGVAGPLEIDNSTVSNNAATAANSEGGGGINNSVENGASYATPMVLTSDIISGNISPENGGGVLVEGTSGQITITNCTISGNTASEPSTPTLGTGGGMSIEAPLTMSGTTVSGNTADLFGGGILLDELTFTDTITTSNFINNTVVGTTSGYTDNSDGAGLCLMPNQGTAAVYSVQYSRFHGNTGGHATGLAVSGPIAANNSAATVTAIDNWWGCNPSTAYNISGSNDTTLAINGTGCDTAGLGNTYTGSLVVLPYTTLVLKLSSTTPSANTSFSATGSLGQNSASTPIVFTQANALGYDGVAATIAITQNGNYNTLTNSPGSTLTATANPAVSYAAIYATATATESGNGLASVTVDGCTIKDQGPTPTCNSATVSNFNVVAPDLIVTSAHTGNFKAGDTADAYTLTVANVGNASTSGTVTVSDSLPGGFTATALSGTGWTCTLSSVTCTRSDQLSSSVTYPPITLTVSIPSTDAGTYTNNATVSGGGETNTNNDTGSDSTIVVGTPTISEAFSPTSVAPNATSTVTFTLGNPSANSVSLTGVAFTDPIPTGLRIVTAATTTCTGTVAGAVNASSIMLSGATIAAGATCIVTAGVQSPSIGSYPNPSGSITATNSNAGGTATATLTVAVTPTRLIFTSVPPSPITAGGNAGTIGIALEDGSGNVATNNSSTTITLLVTGPSGYSQSYMATTSNGVASFNLSSVPLTVAGSYAYTGTATGLTATPVAGEAVNPGSAAFLTVTGLPTFTAPLLAGTATVKVSDAYGNTVTGFTGTVTLSSTTDNTATFSPASYTYTASDAGSHVFTVTFDTAGTQTVTATSGAVTGTQPGVVVEDAIYILNTTDSIVRTTDVGVQTNSYGSTSGTSQAAAIAFGSTGSVWATQFDTNGFVKYSPTGTLTVSASSIGGLNNPASVFLDGNNQAWFANAGGSSVTLLSNAGAAISPSTGYSQNTTIKPVALIVDSSGSVWIADFGGNQVVRLIGAAGPVATPLVTNTLNNTLGTKP